MNRIASAVAGGVAGTSVLSLLLLLLQVESRSAVGIFAAIARFVGLPGQLTVGFALYFLAGSVAWPLIFVAIEERIPRPDHAARGMLFAVPLWMAFVVLGGGPIEGALLVVYVVFTLLAHLAYGFVLGAVYGHLSGHGPEVFP